MVALTVLGFSSIVVHQIQGRRYIGQQEAQNAEFVAAAPTRENLPPLNPAASSNRCCVPESTTGGWQRRRATRDRLTRPDARTRPASCTLDLFQLIRSTAAVTIWQYPTADWARYEARHVTGNSESVVGAHRVLVSDGESWWYRGTRVIRASASPPRSKPFSRSISRSTPATSRNRFRCSRRSACDSVYFVQSSDRGVSRPAAGR